MPLGKYRKMRWDKLNGTYQHLTYTPDMNVLGDIVDTLRRNTETSFGASKDIGFEVNTEKTK
jgi:hypothetical protein